MSGLTVVSLAGSFLLAAKEFPEERFRDFWEGVWFIGQLVVGRLDASDWVFFLTVLVLGAVVTVELRRMRRRLAAIEKELSDSRGA